MTTINGWLEVEPSSGSGTTIVTLSAPAYTELTDRTASLRIEGAGGTVVYLTATQEKYVPPFTVEPDNIQFQWGGGDEYLSIYSEFEWTLELPDWLTSDKMSGNTGNTLVKITANLNTGDSVLYGIISFKNGEKTLGTVNVNQSFLSDDCYYLSNNDTDYIDLGFVPDENCEITIELMVTGQLNEGIIISNESKTFGVFRTSYGTIRGANGQKWATIEFLENQPFILTLKQEGVFINSNLFFSYYKTGDDISKNEHLQIFGGFANENIRIGRIYIKRDEENEMFLFPVEYNDGAKGFFDIINNTFFGFELYTNRSGHLYPNEELKFYTYMYNPDTIKLPSPKANINQVVVSKDDWNIISDDDWVTVTPSSGTSGITIVTVNGNSFEGNRSRIHLSSGSKSIDKDVYMLRNNKYEYTSIDNIPIAESNNYAKFSKNGELSGGAYKSKDTLKSFGNNNIDITSFLYGSYTNGNISYLAFDEDDIWTDLQSVPTDNIVSVKLSNSLLMSQIPQTDTISSVIIPSNIQLNSRTTFYSSTIGRNNLNDMRFYTENPPINITHGKVDNPFINLPSGGTLYYPSGADYSELLDITTGFTPAAYGWSGEQTGSSIFYVSSDSQIIIPNNDADWEYEIVSNTYNGEYGEMTFSGRITEIPSSGFISDERLQTISLPDSVVSIGEAAFSGCNKLTIINFGNGLKNISDYAFVNCNLSYEIIFPDTLETIGKGTFKGNAFTSIILGPNVISIGANANSLSDYVFPETLKHIRITSQNAPQITNNTFYGISENGILEICPFTYYNEWLNNASYRLGYYGWTVKSIEDLFWFYFDDGINKSPFSNRTNSLYEYKYTYGATKWDDFKRVISDGLILEHNFIYINCFQATFNFFPNIDELMTYKIGGNPYITGMVDVFNILHNTKVTDARYLILNNKEILGNTQRIFLNCSSLVYPPELPIIELSDSCYEGMFENCTSLTTAPALPATTLANGCYFEMFSGCTSLTTAPALPATTLEGSCYESMFKNCTSLTTAPELPATTLADGCYKSMFSGCTSLNYLKMDALENVNIYTVEKMLVDVSPTGTLVIPAAATYSDSKIREWTGMPSGWTIVRQ